MIKILKGINPEYKVAAVFAFAAMFVSLLTGAVSGIRFGAVLLRTFCSILVFAGLGLVVFFTVKKYVPELFEFDRQDAENDLLDFMKDDSQLEDGEAAAFTEFSGSDFPNLNEVKDQSGAQSDNNSAGISAGGSMGRHIVEENTDFPYEPEVMAKAVRKMMNKDKD